MDAVDRELGAVPAVRPRSRVYEHSLTAPTRLRRNTTDTRQPFQPRYLVHACWPRASSAAAHAIRQSPSTPSPERRWPRSSLQAKLSTLNSTNQPKPKCYQRQAFDPLGRSTSTPVLTPPKPWLCSHQSVNPSCDLGHRPRIGGKRCAWSGSSHQARPRRPSTP